MSEIDIKIAEKPIGYFVGGDMCRVVECPVCKRPGVTNGKQKKRKGRLIQTFAHRLLLKLTRNNNTEMQIGDVCEWEVV